MGLRLDSNSVFCDINAKGSLQANFAAVVDRTIKRFKIATQDIVKIGAYVKLVKGKKEMDKRIVDVTEDNYMTSLDFVSLPQLKKNFVKKLHSKMGDRYFPC